MSRVSTGAHVGAIIYITAKCYHLHNSNGDVGYQSLDQDLILLLLEELVFDLVLAAAKPCAVVEGVEDGWN